MSRHHVIVFTPCFLFKWINDFPQVFSNLYTLVFFCCSFGTSISLNIFLWRPGLVVGGPVVEPWSFSGWSLTRSSKKNPQETMETHLVMVVILIYESITTWRLKVYSINLLQDSYQDAIFCIGSFTYIYIHIISLFYHEFHHQLWQGQHGSWRHSRELCRVRMLLPPCCCCIFGSGKGRGTNPNWPFFSWVDGWVEFC